MPLRIYNSLTKTKEELIPLNEKRINMYSCGVTVYDECHIGHARSLYVFDCIRRYLRCRGFDVRFVRNITDIDDKIIQKANELNIPSERLAQENIASYYNDLKSLGIEKADAEPKATENIERMIQDIESLIAREAAYVVNGDVYFSVRKFPDYGKLSGQGIEKMLEAVRIEKDSHKKDPLDFALWKKSKDNEPSWPSPWGPGRPGWHIECSCMSLKHLHCETLDIHAGGRDLIFPHHENEIAQAEALSGKLFARYWIHHGLLTINNQKMAKSLGNFITIKDALKKYSADDLKMFFLFSHYASPIDFSEDKMLEAQRALERFDILFWKTTDILEHNEDYEPVQADFIEQGKKNFIEAMDDDFNSPRALAALFDLINESHKFISQMKSNDTDRGILYHAVDTLENFARQIFGLFLQEKEKSLPADLDDLLKERQSARTKKDFKRSDELRILLKEKGVAVEDTPEGQKWRWL